MKNLNLSYVMFGIFVLTVVTVITCGRTPEIKTAPVNPAPKVEEPMLIEETKVEVIEEEVKTEPTPEPVIEEVQEEVQEVVPSEEAPIEEIPEVDSNEDNNLQ